MQKAFDLKNIKEEEIWDAYDIWCCLLLKSAIKAYYNFRGLPNILGEYLVQLIDYEKSWIAEDLKWFVSQVLPV
jgi:hypothetical protein